ncbi:Exosome complex component RRP43 [Camellia lanceoleosa]|uniref:Exosome complex component RRP43 n=1 Tax=Camellia lanceoleosa TaxID=1840588 RepID=A0ACC0G5X1_9ERIC|nr:Exosome complex component RRP43 [Camellia lanceoleosa]
MSSTNASGDLSSEMEVDAFRRLFPLRFHKRHLLESTRPHARKLGKARDTTLALGAVASTDGSALAKIGCTIMARRRQWVSILSRPRVEMMTPAQVLRAEVTMLIIDFHMHPICSSIVRPGKPADAAPVISKQLSNTILSSGMINFKELSLVSGKVAWMAYLVMTTFILFLQDIYCLDADGALSEAAFLEAVAAFSHLQIPVVSLNDDGRVVVISEEDGGKLKCEPVKKGKRKLKLSSVPFSLTCILYKNYMLADPTAEEESIMETLVTVVLDSSFQLVSLYKPDGPVLAYTSAIQLRDCIALTRQSVKELQKVLNEAISEIEWD